MHVTTLRTSLAAPGALLRAALRLDAVVSGANGVAYLLLAGPLADPLDVGATALRLTGAGFLVFAGCVWALSAAAPPRRRLVRAVVAGNALWAVESVVLVAAGVVEPVPLGGAWIVAQGLVVAGFAALQAAGLRRA